MSETVTPSALTMQSVFRALFFDLSRQKDYLGYVDEDLMYLLSRLESEGTSFCLTVLPKLGKAVETSLITEEPLQVPQGWSLRKGTRLPLFLNGLFIEVFEGNGALRPEVNERAVFFLRQICLIFSKVVGVVSDEMKKEAVSAFLQRVTVVPEIQFSEPLIRAREILHHYLDGTTFACRGLQEFYKKPWGRHGPGAVSDLSTPVSKWTFQTWPGLCQGLFTLGSSCLLSEKRDEQPSARICCVPKDFRGPRVICIEPKENQFAQQGLMDLLYRFIERHPLTRGAISFRSCERSWQLCYSREAATIDLKDASDRLSLALVRFLYPRWFFRLITRYRTRSVTWNGQTYPIHCFATMGSALCFPIETLTFWALAQAVRPHDSRSLTPLRVFGDDIITDRKVASKTLDALRDAQFIINQEKTCTKTLVKESCGEWVVSGMSQRILKVKTDAIKAQREWMSWVDYLDHPSIARLPALRESILELLRFQIPDQRIRIRWNKELQRKEFRVPTLVEVGHRTELSPYARLYAYFVGNDQTPRAHGSQKLKWHWTPFYPYR